MNADLKPEKKKTGNIFTLLPDFVSLDFICVHLRKSAANVALRRLPGVGFCAS
jgi:hypothetical protein